MSSDLSLVSKRSGQRERLQNWPLLFGLLVVVLVLAIALIGPSLAPHDPLEENHVIQVGDKWYTAPFPPLTIPGFALGTDKFGRDVLSQMLWALRPTLLLVTVVAVVRLVAGTLLGLAAGWVSGGWSRLLDTLISAALSVPVLIVALAGIAVVAGGHEGGPGAFVFGLSITGWAESARIIRDQTRIVRGQLYIEAGKALGERSPGLLFRHVLRQVAPMLWMLMAFEISHTLIATAGLGFLGYYVGGDVWIWISDTAAARLSGSPELGQMLSSVTEDIYTGPWKMFAAGTLVFVTVLGFNLLGEGLRIQANAEMRRSLLGDLPFRLSVWWEDRAWTPLKSWTRAHPLQAAFSGLLALVVVGGLSWLGVSARGPAASSILPVPGGHLWPTAWHDPHGTLWTDVPGPRSADIAWTLENESGYPGGPAVARDGTVYLVAGNGALTALDPDGTPLWATVLEVQPAAAPALDADGNLYITDRNGGLTALSSSGEVLWVNRPALELPATSGAVVSVQGPIFYTIGGDVRAVSLEGETLWQNLAATRILRMPPVLSPEGEYVIMREKVLDARDGSIVEFSDLPVSEQYIVSANGRTFSRFETYLTEFFFADDGPRLIRKVHWQSRRFFGQPGVTGVLPDGTYWLHFNSAFEDSSLAWMDEEAALIGAARFPHRPSYLVAIDREFVYYVCGSRRTGGAECLAYPRGAEEPLWSLPLPGAESVTGGALVPGRLYVTTAEGHFFAIDESGD